MNALLASGFLRLIEETMKYKIKISSTEYLYIKSNRDLSGLELEKFAILTIVANLQTRIATQASLSLRKRLLEERNLLGVLLVHHKAR